MTENLVLRVGDVVKSRWSQKEEWKDDLIVGVSVDCGYPEYRTKRGAWFTEVSSISVLSEGHSVVFISSATEETTLKAIEAASSEYEEDYDDEDDF